MDPTLPRRATGDIAVGNWNVTIGKDDKAEVSITVFYVQGSLHAAWGGNYFFTKFTQNDPGENYFDVTSGNKQFVLDDQGQLTFSIADFDCGTSEKTVHLRAAVCPFEGSPVSPRGTPTA